MLSGVARVWFWGALTLGCAHRSAPPTLPRSGKATAVVSPDALQGGGPLAAAWVVYIARKSALYDQLTLPAANDSADDYGLELGARTAQSAFWAEQRQSGAPPSAELDRQTEIWRAGFLPEYVLLVHGRPGWTVPPEAAASLRIQEFITRFSGRYEAGTLAVLKPASGKLAPDEPGGDFPDPEELPLWSPSCGRAVEARSAAWTRWGQLTPRLGGLPISAHSSLELGRQLVASRRDPRFRGKPITWVSERVAYLAYLEGFCAVEKQDWPAGVTALERAAALEPSNANVHLELALALAAIHRHEEALAEVDRVLGTNDDACLVALGWRRRGYVLFELGELGAARAAYEKSLTFEPDSAVAQDELTTIADALKVKGSPGSGRTYLPPPARLLTTSCEAGKSVAARPAR